MIKREGKGQGKAKQFNCTDDIVGNFNRFCPTVFKLLIPLLATSAYKYIVSIRIKCNYNICGSKDKTLN